MKSLLKKILVIQLFFWVNTNCFSQEIELLIDRLGQITKVSEVLGYLQDESSSWKEGLGQIDQVKQIKDYSQIEVSVVEGKTYFWYNIVILEHKGDIIFSSLSNEESPKKMKRYEVLYQNDVELLRYIQKYNEHYQSKNTKADFLRDYKSDYVVGKGCGYSGNYTCRQMKQMIRYVSNNNLTKLSDWLRSFSPELQTIGIIGLKILESKGEIIGTDITRIIAERINQNPLVINCVGCIYGKDKLVNVVEVQTIKK